MTTKIKNIEEKLGFYQKKNIQWQEKMKKNQSYLNKNKLKKNNEKVIKEIKFIKEIIEMIDNKISKLLDKKRTLINSTPLENQQLLTTTNKNIL